MNLTPDVLITVIQYLIGFIAFFATIFCAMIGVLHRSMTRRLDLIEQDLKPILAMIKVHEEQIMEIKQDNKEIHKWLNHYDGRIQTIEHKLRA